MLDFLKTDPLDKRQCSASESQDSHGASIMGWLASGSRAAHTSPWELLGQAGGSAGQGSDTRVPASAQAADRKLRPLLAYFFRRNARGQTKWVTESLPEITLFNLAAVLRLLSSLLCDSAYCFNNSFNSFHNYFRPFHQQPPLKHPRSH